MQQSDAVVGLATGLKDKVVLITGAASGIGAAAARAFAAEGAVVVLSDINAAAGEALAGELNGSFVKADVTSEEQVQAAVQFAVQRHGRLDCMVNNAGLIGVVGSLLETSKADWDRTMSVLLDSVFYGIKHAGRQMREQRSGVILSLSSLAGVCAGMGPHVYSVAKHAVVALTRTAAAELSQYGVRVNAVAPGLVVTPLVDQVYGTRESTLDKAAEASPLGSAAMPEEIAQSLVYLASEQAQHITAHVLVVDSGVSVAGSSGAALFHERPIGFMGTLPE
jgi:NAD(P)-dependent dehydrogenase (short-subunit alcohol dehydrogenase family)